MPETIAHGEAGDSGYRLCVLGGIDRIGVLLGEIHSCVLLRKNEGSAEDEGSVRQGGGLIE